MGLLSQGTPLSWTETQLYSEFVRQNGVQQFINIYRESSSRSPDRFLWGEEVEYTLVHLEENEAWLVLRAEEVIERLASEKGALWHPEFGRFMVEGTPYWPYTGDPQDLARVEESLQVRRRLVQKALLPNEQVLTIGNYPRLGLRDSFPHGQAYSNRITRSAYFPDEAICVHPRFKALAQSIRERRGRVVAISVPVFRDTHTPASLLSEDEALFPEELAKGKAGEVHMDAMGFGMGCNSLQITCQARDVDEARRLYDQLVPLAPIMLALSAATPIFRGYLTETDCRWDVIAASVDDRTADESSGRIGKSRFSSVSRYISCDPRLKPEHNDLVLAYHQPTYETLIAEGFDELMARHISHLFIREPLAVYRQLLQQDNTYMTDHFENIQSSNWQSVRFKPPPAHHSDIGWRVEFRTIEIQPDDFANAAFCVFVVLLTRAILAFDLDFYQRLSEVDQNFRAAQLRDAVRSQRFQFRANPGSAAASVREMDICEIVNGSDSFVGLVPLARRYLEQTAADRATLAELDRYLDFIGRRASGSLVTPSRWMRNFVLAHPQYAHDSRVTAAINRDLLAMLAKIGDGVCCPSDLCHVAKAAAVCGRC